MKIEMAVGGRKVLFTPEQMDAVLQIVSQCECLDEKYVGPGKGENGSNYMVLLEPVNISELQLKAVMSDTIEARRLVTKLHKEQNN